MEKIILSGNDFSGSKIKNSILKKTDKEKICFICEEFCDESLISEIDGISAEEDVIVFGKGANENMTLETPYEFLPLIPEIKIYAMNIKKELCTRVGLFHPLFFNGTNEEWLLRALEKTKVRFQNVEVCKGQNTGIPCEATAFFCAKKMLSKQIDNAFNEAMKNLIIKLEESGDLPCFMDHMRRFTSDRQELDKYINTISPILIISGDDTCYGLLKYMSHNLAVELVKSGQAVVTTDGEYEGYEGAEDFKLKHWKAVLGIHSSFLYSDFIKDRIYPKLCFWFDNPIFFDHFSEKIENENYLLMADMDYSKYLQEYYDAKNALFLPPGGVDTGLSIEEIRTADRDLDAVFIGTYKDTSEPLETEDEKKVFDFLLSDPDKTIEEALAEISYDWIGTDREVRLNTLKSMRTVQRNIANHFRDRIIEEILNAGIKINVFGDSWYNYKGKNREYLIINKELSPDEIPDILLRSKISLNIMYWHKSGMTERVIQSMLCGAVCLTDSTRYLKEEYTDGQDISLFELSEIDTVPNRIKGLLENDELRIEIAEAGYRHALEKETWKNRVDSIEGLLDDHYEKK